MSGQGFTLPIARRRRKPSLTPMIDVVFLLLVFFMLAARFGHDQALPLATGGEGGGTWQGAPRLVTVAPGEVRLNGVAVAPEALAGALQPLMPQPGAPVILRPVEEAPLQNIVDVVETLRRAGIDNLVLVE